MLTFDSLDLLLTEGLKDFLKHRQKQLLDLAAEQL